MQRGHEVATNLGSNSSGAVLGTPTCQFAGNAIVEVCSKRLAVSMLNVHSWPLRLGAILEPSAWLVAEALG